MVFPAVLPSDIAAAVFVISRHIINRSIAISTNTGHFPQFSVKPKPVFETETHLEAAAKGVALVISKLGGYQQRHYQPVLVWHLQFKKI